MWEEDVLANFAAASDTILPRSSVAGIHKMVAALFDGAVPGYSVLVSGLLDAFAAEIRPGSSFAALTDEERISVFKKMAAEESVDIKDVVDGLFLFTLGQNYSEAHPDHHAVWERIGYHGPSIGVRDYA